MECSHCHNQFQPSRADARFCSDRCRVAAHRARAQVALTPNEIEQAQAAVTYYRAFDRQRGGKRRRFPRKIERVLERGEAIHLLAGRSFGAPTTTEAENVVLVYGTDEIHHWIDGLDQDQAAIGTLRRALLKAIERTTKQ
jgi:hypothetical protein